MGYIIYNKKKKSSSIRTRPSLSLISLYRNGATPSSLSRVVSLEEGIVVGKSLPALSHLCRSRIYNPLAVYLDSLALGSRISLIYISGLLFSNSITFILMFFSCSLFIQTNLSPFHHLCNILHSKRKKNS